VAVSIAILIAEAVFQLGAELVEQLSGDVDTYRAQLIAKASIDGSASDAAWADGEALMPPGDS
jgi:hypothetical protein